MSLSTPSPADPVWTSGKSVPIPTTDIVTFAFANLGQYDNDKPIFIDATNPSNSVSAAEARRVVSQLVKGLKDFGVKEGDCVCLHAYNNIWYPLIWLAIIGSGARVSGTNPACKSAELDRHLKLTKPKLIFAQASCMQPVIEAASKCNMSLSSIFVVGAQEGSSSEGCRGWRTLLSEDEGDWKPAFQDGDSAQERIAAYATTSGTTGLPKAAMIPHSYLVAQTAVLEGQFDARPYQPSQLICLPVFHAFASPLALVLPLRLGVPTYFLPKFTLPGFLHAIHAFSITDTPVVPPIIGALSQLSTEDRDRLQSLRYVICAGAPMAAAVQAKFHTILHSEAVVAQCWGTTETGWHTLFHWAENDTSGSVGRLLPNIQIKVIDADGVAVKDDDKDGEALVRSSAMFSGYLENPDANREAFDADGFYRTGDHVRIQAGKVFYIGRFKEILKVNGWQVSPSELESVLVEHPQILDAVVFGLCAENLSGMKEMLPCAYVVRMPVGPLNSETGSSKTNDGTNEEELTSQGVKDFVASRLISYKHLTGLVTFVKSIPRSPTGKILRRQLSDIEFDPSEKAIFWKGMGIPDIGDVAAAPRRDESRKEIKHEGEATQESAKL